MNPDRQLILAEEILKASATLDREAAEGVDVDLDDYISIQRMAELLARSLVKSIPEQARLLSIVEKNTEKHQQQFQELVSLLDKPEMLSGMLNKIQDRIENDDIVEFNADTVKLDKCAVSKVRYTCEFEAIIVHEDDEDVQDAVSNIDIPEGGKNNSHYQENTFNVISIDGEPV